MKHSFTKGLMDKINIEMGNYKSSKNFKNNFCVEMMKSVLSSVINEA